MKKFLVGILVLGSMSSFAGENYLAEDLKKGTEVEILNEIKFPEKSTGVFIQNGKIFHDGMDGLKSTKAHCFLTVRIADYNQETGMTESIKETEKYRVNSVYRQGSRGSINIHLSSEFGREVDLDCQKDASIVSKISDSTGIDIYMDNLTKLRINNVKKTLASILKIND
jgi:hypothetical protein